MRRDRLRAEILRFMDAHVDGSRDDAALDALLREVAAFQADAVPVYAKLAARHAHRQLPAAVPTDVFRFARLAVHPEHEDVRIFRTSGTTHRERGMHAFRELSLYDRAAEIQARRYLFPDERPIRLFILAAPSSEAPDSSLSHMLDLFGARFGSTSRHYLREDRLLGEELAADLRAAEAQREPVALLGTSYAFVYAEDALGAQRFALPAGSRLMQTGGFKGRTREHTPGEMRAMLSSRYGIPDDHVVAEYGMTELSSQFYEPTLRASLLGEPAGPRRYVAAPWVRALPVDPSSLEPVADGELGILRIDDLANLDSIACIQTSDLARRAQGEIELVGRVPGATPRGCSLAVDEMLGGDR
jgi:hypothetical protein